MGTTISTIETETREVRRNYFTDPRFTGTTWGTTAGSTVSVTGGVLDVTNGTATGSNFITPELLTAFAPGDLISAAYLVQNLHSTPLVFRIAFWNGTAYTYGSLVTVGVGATERVTSENVVTPAGSAYMQPRLHGTVPVGARLLISKPMAEEAAAVGPYFDGSTSPDPDLTPSWTGPVNASASILTGVFPLFEVAPVAVEGYEATRETGTVIHDIVGAEFPDASLRPAGSRRGRMRLAFATEAAAVDAFLALAYVGVFTCTNPTVPGIDMDAFVVAGEDLTIEADDSGAAWWVGMPFVEVAP